MRKRGEYDIHPSFMLLNSLFYLTISKKPPQGEVLYKLSKDVIY
jgi:hypothetical protein